MLLEFWEYTITGEITYFVVTFADRHFCIDKRTINYVHIDFILFLNSFKYIY
jgi:hypothetical protein